MNRQIESVAVLGCGTMGSGIAAASAAAGCRVLMLDVTLAVAERGLSAVDDGDRHLVEVGTFDDLARIADYDWICEAIVEDLATKRQLFAAVEPLRRDGSVVSSNTSGIPLRGIAAGMPDRFQEDVAITHFFNPVRVMKLFELVPGVQTRAEVIDAFAEFGAMTQETINAALGKPVGLPPTGLYGLIDLIGLDVMDLVGKNLAINLPSGDAGLAYTAFPGAEQRMLERGQLGRKARDLGGFGRVGKLPDGTNRRQVGPSPLSSGFVPAHRPTVASCAGSNLDSTH